MEKKDGIPELIGSLLGDILGWAFCMAILAGAYLLGYALAGYFGGASHREAFGLLSAINVIWIYEHRRNDERWTKFLKRAS
jgi:hypothetical protein